MTFFNKHIASVSARMMTWEVTTSFDGTLTDAELRRRFDDDFRDALIDESAELRCSNHVLFWPLVSFNASDGRKHRYLVATADEPLVAYRKKFDHCLPRQVALYAIADKVLRGEWKNCDAVNHVGCDESRFFENTSVVENGNLLFVALWKNVLYVLVFVNGRLCHWSEESGYGEIFDERCLSRVERFKTFLSTDELFANTGASDVGLSNVFGKVYLCCDRLTNMDELFQLSSRDPFWRSLDLDACDTMKLCEKRRWMMRLALLLALCTALALTCGNSRTWNRSLEWLHFGDSGRTNLIANVAPVELSSPAIRDLELLAWAKGHGDWTIIKRNVNRGASLEGFVGTVEESSGHRQKFLQNSRCGCDASAITLLGIVGGRAALVATADGKMKTLSQGDSVFAYRVKRIGVDDIVLRCGGKEVRYAIQMR